MMTSRAQGGASGEPVAVFLVAVSWLFTKGNAPVGRPLSVVSQILFESTAVKTTVQDQTRKSLLGEIEGSEAEVNDAPPSPCEWKGLGLRSAIRCVDAACWASWGRCIAHDFRLKSGSGGCCGGISVERGGAK